MSLVSVLHAPLAFTPSPDGSGGSPLMGLVPLVLVMFIFFFLVIRPQQKRHKDHKTMVSALSKGDRVLTSGGLYATVQDVKDNLVVVTIADGVKVEIAKSAVTAKVSAKSKSAKKDDK